VVPNTTNNVMKFSELLKIHLIRRIPALLGAGFIVLAFTLYYVGIIDVSFIDRPEEWSDNINLLAEMIDPDKKEKNDQKDQASEENDTPESEKNDVPTSDNRPSKRPNNNGDPAPNVNLMPTFSSVAALKEEGYRLTDKPWDSTTVFGKLECNYSWPREFSYSWKIYDKQEKIEHIDGTETTVENVRVSGERAALELYMGYIIYDDNDTLYLIGPDGAVLMEYDDTVYIPAYTRDLEGRPLFYKQITRKEKYPVLLGNKDDKGNYKWDKTGTLTYTDKEYYYLAKDGHTFKKSDYNDVTDNRGLYFDYPSYYGAMDSKFSRYFFNTTKFFTDLKGETGIVHDLNWVYSKNKIELEKLKFDEEGFLITDEEQKEGEEKTLNSMFPYTMAYNFNEKYATVFMDIDWSYEHDVKNEEGKTEKKTFDVTTNEMRIINEKGEVMFDAKKNYYSPEFKWTSHERFVAPLYNGIQSIGSYYFDHGLMRIRIQTYDCYYYSEFDTIKIVTDEDVLIYPNGERFNIPNGYTLISYSDGILLLEKDGKYGFMNYMGNWIRDPEYPDAGPFIEGVAVLQSKEGNYGVVNTDGEIVIPFIYDYVSNISSGTIVAYSDNTGWTVYQKMTK